MTKTIVIEGKEMKARASALIPRLYRYHFNRDIIQDMKKLDSALHSTKADGKEFTVADLSIFEDVAWLFFKLGGEEVGESPDEWLDTIDGMFSIYEVLPQLLELWNLNLEQTAKPKKK